MKTNKLLSKRLYHEFESIISNDSKILILGSFPSVKSREKNFYYMNKQNRFWQILSLIFNDDFINDDIEVKKRLLKKYKIALYDVIESCLIIGSSDTSIREIKPANISNLIKHTEINKIYVNGKKAYELFIKYNAKLSEKAFLLPSTSSANAKYSIEKLISFWEVINN